MPLSKSRSLALTWLLALGLSALLVAAGRRWPQSLPIHAPWVWGALLALPLATLALLLLRWKVPDGRESSGAMQER